MNSIRSVIILSLGMSFLSPTAFAQTQGETQFGLKGGINLSTHTGDDVENELGDLSHRLGFAAGIAGRHWFNPELSVQFEGLFSQQGAKGEFEGTDIESETKLTYIEIPVLLRYGFDMSRTLDGGIYGGPGLGIPVGEGSLEVEGVEDELEMELNVDYGLNVGLQLGSEAVYLDGRFTYGLTNPVSEIEGVELEDDYEASNQKFQITLGYWFQ